MLLSTEGPTSMLVTVYGGSCLDDGAAVMDDDDEGIICTQNQEMQALTEGTFCKQSSQEPKIEELKEPEELEEPEEMEEDKLLLHLVQPTSVGGLPHDSSDLNNVTGKRVQRKEARYFQLLNPEIFLVIDLSYHCDCWRWICKTLSEVCVYG
jgi:hypothetical protein